MKAAPVDFDDTLAFAPLENESSAGYEVQTEVQTTLEVEPETNDAVTTSEEIVQRSDVDMQPASVTTQEVNAEAEVGTRPGRS